LNRQGESVEEFSKKLIFESKESGLFLTRNYQKNVLRSWQVFSLKKCSKASNIETAFSRMVSFYVLNIEKKKVLLTRLMSNKLTATTDLFGSFVELINSDSLMAK
jgi:hypothetical protein